MARVAKKHTWKTNKGTFQKIHEKTNKGTFHKQKTDLPRGKRLCTQTPDLGLSSLLVGSLYHLQILFVSPANTFLYCLQYFLHGLQILFVSSVTAFFGGLHSTSFLQRLQILKHSYLSCPIINIDHCSLIHII